MKLKGDGIGSTCYVVGTADHKFSNNVPTFVNPLDLDSYDAITTKVVAPLNVWYKNRRSKPRHFGVMFMQTDEPLPLMQLAARKCFYDMKRHQLKTLCTELEVVPLTPDMLGHLEILINTILPDLSLQEVNDILELRCELPEDPLSVFVQDLDVVEAMFPEEDLKLLKEFL
jgi:hypothetical protein